MKCAGAKLIGKTLTHPRNSPIARFRGPHSHCRTQEVHKPQSVCRRPRNGPWAPAHAQSTPSGPEKASYYILSARVNGLCGAPKWKLPYRTSALKGWLQLRFDFDSTAIRPPFDLTALEDLRHNRAATLRPK